MRATSLRVVLGVSGLLVSFGLLAGCATSSRVVYTKPGVSAAERERDENACLRSSIGLDDEQRILTPFEIDRSIFRSCMEARGYVAKPK
jgi:hypothetical protein